MSQSVANEYAATFQHYLCLWKYLINEGFLAYKQYGSVSDMIPNDKVQIAQCLFIVQRNEFVWFLSPDEDACRAYR